MDQHNFEMNAIHGHDEHQCAAEQNF